MGWPYAVATIESSRMRTRMPGMSSDVENRVDGGEGSPFLESSSAGGDAEYDNSKNLRHGESLFDMAKTPGEISQSVRSDVSLALVRDLLISLACFSHVSGLSPASNGTLPPPVMLKTIPRSRITVVSF